MGQMYKWAIVLVLVLISFKAESLGSFEYLYAQDKIKELELNLSLINWGIDNAKYKKTVAHLKPIKVKTEYELTYYKNKLNAYVYKD